MTVRLGDGAVLLEGTCLIDDAAPLLDLMLAHPGLPIDLDECVRIHMAVAQILLAARPAVRGHPKDVFLKDRLVPLLATWTN